MPALPSSILVMVSVATFYKFVRVGDLLGLQDSLYNCARKVGGLKGTILLAEEGINGTIAGKREAIDALAQFLHQSPEFADLQLKYSSGRDGNQVFSRFKIKIRPEIVTFGDPDIDPSRRTGKHLMADEWNSLIKDPEVMLIDVRNHYEIGIGRFPNSIHPNSDSFKQFSDYVNRHLDSASNKKIAMYCTGGIRCEKASAFMLDQGFKNVYQLEGGVLKYLETVESEENHWEGECFVFDKRVSVDKDLQEGSYEQCFACRHPLSAEDMLSSNYKKGISCTYCIDHLTQRQIDSFKEREHQLSLAASKGKQYIGDSQSNDDVR